MRVTAVAPLFHYQLFHVAKAASTSPFPSTDFMKGVFAYLCVYKYNSLYNTISLHDKALLTQKHNALSTQCTHSSHTLTSHLHTSNNMRAPIYSFQ